MATRLTPCTLRSRRCLKAGYVSANDENLNKIANALSATCEHLVYTLEMHGSLILQQSSFRTTFYTRWLLRDESTLLSQTRSVFYQRRRQTSRCHDFTQSSLNVRSQAPFTRYNLLSNRLSNRCDNRLYRVYKHSTGCQTGDNRFDNRLHVSLHDTAGCQTGCTTGFTTGCIV